LTGAAEKTRVISLTPVKFGGNCLIIQNDFLLGNHPNPAPLFIDHRHRFIAVGAFDIDEIIEETDTIMIDEEVEFLFTGRTSSEVTL
jgi:hypothetical protein